jgi:hypothetical protein
MPFLCSHRQPIYQAISTARERARGAERSGAEAAAIRHCNDSYKRVVVMQQWRQQQPKKSDDAMQAHAAHEHPVCLSQSIGAARAEPMTFDAASINDLLSLNNVPQFFVLSLSFSLSLILSISLSLSLYLSLSSSLSLSLFLSLSLSLDLSLSLFLSLSLSISLSLSLALALQLKSCHIKVLVPSSFHYLLLVTRTDSQYTKRPSRFYVEITTAIRLPNNVRKQKRRRLTNSAAYIFSSRDPLY